MFNEREFRAALARNGMTQAELAETLGISAVTLYRKLKRGGDFTRSEINQMLEVLGIEDPKGIFFAQELAQT